MYLYGGQRQRRFRRLQSPYVYPMDPDAADALLSAAENFRLGTRLLPVTDENRTAYGLDAPQAVVKITQREGLNSQIDSAGMLHDLRRWNRRSSR